MLPSDALKVAHLAGTVVAAIAAIAAAAIEVAIIATSNGSTKTPVSADLSIAAIEVRLMLHLFTLLRQL